MNILFIGGTGNISLSSSKRLLAQGHNLTILNRTGSHPELVGAHFIRADIGNPNMNEILGEAKWDAVVNWVAFEPKDIERDFALFANRTDQYVFISSASCYQNPGPTSIITERTPLENPYWQYSRNKIQCEENLQILALRHGFPYTIVRPSHTYDTVIPITIGGWTEYTAVARIKAGKPVVVQGDGTSLWTLTHAEDFAVGICGLLGNKKVLGETFHLTSDEALSWNEIYQTLAEAVGCTAQLVHVTSDLICNLDPEYTGSLLGDKSSCAVFDNSKIKSVVPDFQAKIPFREGIKRTLNWFESAAERQYVNPETDALIETLITSTQNQYKALGLDWPSHLN